MKNKLINEILLLHDKLGLIVEKEYNYESISEFDSVYSDINDYQDNNFEDFKTNKELKEYIKYLENLIKVVKW